jgi:predicted nucleic acid-binding protein
MGPVVLDSDVASLAFRRRLAPTLAARLAGRVLCVSFVTLAEMTVWAEVRHWGPTNQAALRDWLGGLVRLPYDDEVARTWGRWASLADEPSVTEAVISERCHHVRSSRCGDRWISVGSIVTG